MTTDGPSPPPPPVPVGIDLGSLHARLAVTDALPLSDVSSASSPSSPASVSLPIPEPRVVSNAQGSRYTLAASTLDVSHPPVIDEYGGSGSGGSGADENGNSNTGSNGNNRQQQPEVQFIFGEAARKTLTRHKRPLGQSLVRQLSTLSVCGSVDWTDDEDDDDDTMEEEGAESPPSPPSSPAAAAAAASPPPPKPEEKKREAKTAAEASAAFFSNLATLACDATSSHPSQLRAVVSVPANADRRTVRGVVDSAELGLANAIAKAEGKATETATQQQQQQQGQTKKNKNKKKKMMKNSKDADNAKVVGVLTDPAAVCVAHGLTDAAAATAAAMGSNNEITLGGDDNSSSAPMPNAGPSYINWRHALVLDWGASGLTLSHVKRLGSSDVLSIVETTNDPTLSGRTLTDLLVAHCASQFERKCRVSGVLDSKKSRARLEAACEIAIRTLGRATSCHVTVDGLYEGMDLNVPVSRPRFDMLCGPALRKAEVMVKASKDTLAAAAADGGGGADGGAAAAAFDVVLLAGNVSLMPSVKAMVDRLFPAGDGDDSPAAPWRGRSDIPPDEGVAMGCARHAASLVDPTRASPTLGSGGDRRRFWRQEAVVLSPVSVSVCTLGDDDSRSSLPVTLIEAGTPLPAFASKRIALNDGAGTLGVVQMIDGNKEKLLSRIDDVRSCTELTIELSREGKLSISIDGGEPITL